mmetsp:Transcript_31746/g.36438  ORF Transcript_31746/g.36438 Transcript_31746/m.36438 type:complete len:421 (+) Transcript_31746:30-1292(+)
MPEKKIIAVMGATGLQGGAVVNALLTLPNEFSVRAITRHPDSDQAKALVTKGCAVVQADADNVPSMVAAFSGAYGAFLVTNFWADMSMTHEIETTDKLRQAVSEAQVEHVVLSTLEDTRPIVNALDDKETWKILDEAHHSYVPHLDGKGEAGQRFWDDSEVPVTLLFTAFYYDNFINYGMGPQKHGGEDQPLSITFPLGDTVLPMNSLHDIGGTVVSILQDPSTIHTKQGVASTILTGTEIAATFAKVLGAPVVFHAVPTEVYASFGFPGAAVLSNMFRFWGTFEDTLRTVEATEQRLGRKTDALEAWIEKHKAAFMIVPAEEKSLDLLEQMRTVLEAERRISDDQDINISECEAKIAELEATNTLLTEAVASKERECTTARGKLATKGKQFDHLRAAVLAAAKAVVTGPPPTSTTTKAE